MSINTASNISSFVNTVFEDALFVARDNNLMSSLVTFFDDRTGSASRQNSINASVTINAVGESDDLTSQAFTPTSLATLTPAEYGAQYFITDYRMESDIFGVRQDAAQELGMGLAQSIETNLLGNFSSLTGGTVGAAGSTLTWGHIAAAHSRHRANNAPGPYFCVLHPYQWHPLAAEASVSGVHLSTPTVNAGNLQDLIQSQFYVGSALGVNFFISSNISVDASDDAYGALFSRPAMAMDMRRAPRIESERDASRRGEELNLSTVYAHGVWRPAFGVQILSDASAPNF